MQSSNLMVRRVDRNDITRIYFEGTFDEATELSWSMFDRIRCKVRFNLRGVALINSCGIREWIRFINEAPTAVALEYEQCSVCFTREMARIANFLGRGVVRSFHLPIYCETCDVEMTRLVVVEGAPQPMEFRCERCGRRLDPEFLPAGVMSTEDAASPPPHGATLEELQQAASALLHASSDAALLVGDDGVMCYANPALCDLLGLTASEVVGRELGQLMSFELDGRPLDPLQASAAGRPTRLREVTLRQRPSGSLVLEITPVKGGVLLSVKDLALEAALHTKYRDLYQQERDARQLLAVQHTKLGQTARELEQARTELQGRLEALEQAQTRLAVAERLSALGQMAGTLAHEINNPAGAVLAALSEMSAELEPLQQLQAELTRGVPAERLMERVTGEPVRRALQALPETLEDAQSSMLSIRRIAEDLRVFLHGRESRASGARLEELIEAACRVVRHIRPTGVKLVRDLAPTKPVQGAPTRLLQVIVNLLSNAMAAIPPDREGEVRIVTASRGSNVLLSVEDTGVGMDAATRERMFEPFFTTRPPGEGTGIGLSLVREVVDAVGGAIEVDSAPGVGTSVLVQLPTVEHGTSLADDAAALVPASRRRVLLVDDDERYLRSMQRFLSRFVEVECVTSGEEALARLAAGASFDAVALDLQMPGLSGGRLIERLELAHAGACGQIIVLSGGDPASEVQVVVDRYPMLRKPFEPMTLVRLISGDLDAVSSF